ncbi:hypothetical protein BS78_04G094100 [Paspalum vaginatum]|nr:hypothetical protein BS78_04G094100 [Paspalum vaginatum]
MIGVTRRGGSSFCLVIDPLDGCFVLLRRRTRASSRAGNMGLYTASEGPIACIKNGRLRPAWRSKRAGGLRVVAPWLNDWGTRAEPN